MSRPAASYTTPGDTTRDQIKVNPFTREGTGIEPDRKIDPIAVMGVLLPGRAELGCTAEGAEAFACGRNSRYTSAH